MLERLVYAFDPRNLSWRYQARLSFILTLGYNSALAPSLTELWGQIVSWRVVIGVAKGSDYWAETLRWAFGNPHEIQPAPAPLARKVFLLYQEFLILRSARLKGVDYEKRYQIL